MVVTINLRLEEIAKIPQKYPLLLLALELTDHVVKKLGGKTTGGIGRPSQRRLSTFLLLDFDFLGFFSNERCRFE